MKANITGGLFRELREKLLFGGGAEKLLWQESAFRVAIERAPPAVKAHSIVVSCVCGIGARE